MVYSSSGLECQTGMVAVINSDALQTLTTYRAKAKTSFKNTSPDSIFGGVLSKSSKSSGEDKRNDGGRVAVSIVGASAAALGIAAALV